MTKIKICGFKEIEPALAATRAGADFLGFVFAPSPRQVTPEKAAYIIEAVRDLKPRPEVVGVFVNRPALEINRLADYCRLDRVQLSGDELPSMIPEIERPVIKAIHITNDKTPADIRLEVTASNELGQKRDLVFLLDTRGDSRYGGTGQTFDWQLAVTIPARSPMIVAGGLTPANVGRLINEMHPWGIDVSSGVETANHKDISKIKAFIRAVRQAEQPADGQR